MDKDIAISVKNVSKTFKIPHEKVSSLRGAAVSAFSRNKGFEEFKALDDVSFEVKKGEFFGIIGRNGSGKSTLLKILAGIYQADAGSVVINGRISPFLELGIGFNPELSGRDNVYLNATVLGLTKKEIDEKFVSIVKFSELERFIDQKLKNYSSGMQVRLAFSVSIHANREILLMDEVLAVGDSNFQSKCISEFVKYREQNKTVVLVTHDIAIAQRYCDRLMLVEDGKIRIIGEPKDVVKEYMYKNILDEEDRILYGVNEKLENKDVVNKNFKDEKNERFAKISNVIITDKDGKEKNVFLSGELMSICIKINIYKKIKNPEFGIIISNMENVQLFNTNTALRGIKTGEFSVGLHDVYFEIKNLFNPGMLKLTAAISSEHAETFYDWRDDVKMFEVFSENPTIGLINLEHNIIINK